MIRTRKIRNQHLNTHVATLAAGTVIAVTASVMIGWALGIRSLIQIVPGWVPMQFNTALGLALCGGALLAMVQRRFRLAQSLAAPAGMLGLLTLLQIVTGIDLGVDNLVVDPYVTDATSTPGRMAPGTAIAMIVTAMCVSLKSHRERTMWRIVLAQCLAAGLGGVAASAILTYVTDAERGYLWGSLSEMALHTATCFALLAGAILYRSWTHIKCEEPSSPAVLTGLIVLCGAIFVADAYAPRGIGIGVVYVVPILLSLNAGSGRDTIAVACAATVFTVFGYFFFNPSTQAPLWIALCNRSIAILAIFLVTLITLRAQRIAALERERDDLSSAIDAMEQVIGVVGHELRTPLAAVRASAELVLTNYTTHDDDAHIFIQSIHDEIIRMAEMVNNLLEAARLNNGTARWNWGEVRVRDACDEAMSIIRPLIDHSRINLTLSVNPPDLRMRGDAEAVRRLMVNFISNAAKHTSRGSIDISAEPVQIDGHDWVRLRVRDTGEGIDERIVEKLGRAFVLSSGVVGSDYVRGAGLGLAICRAIVSVHGGSIDVESAVDAGATFNILLRADLSGPAEYSETTRIHWRKAA